MRFIDLSSRMLPPVVSRLSWSTQFAVASGRYAAVEFILRRPVRPRECGRCKTELVASGTKQDVLKAVAMQQRTASQCCATAVNVSVTLLVLVGNVSSAQESSQSEQHPVASITTTAGQREPSVEERTRVHRLKTNKRSAFDAFAYVNRIPLQADDEETPEDLAGRIFGRLANQEGRVLLKLPPGMNRVAYEGFKTFLRSEGTESAGNCIVCHTLPNLTDLQSHISTPGRKALPTPSLRNLKKSREDLRQVMLSKLRTSRLKNQGNANDVDPEYAGIHLQIDDIEPVIAFLQTLQDVSDIQFRRQILQAKQLDTSGDIE